MAQSIDNCTHIPQFVQFCFLVKLINYFNWFLKHPSVCGNGICGKCNHNSILNYSWHNIEPSRSHKHMDEILIRLRDLLSTRQTHLSEWKLNLVRDFHSPLIFLVRSMSPLINYKQIHDLPDVAFKFMAVTQPCSANTVY